MIRIIDGRTSRNERVVMPDGFRYGWDVLDDATPQSYGPMLAEMRRWCVEHVDPYQDGWRFIAGTVWFFSERDAFAFKLRFG